MPFIVLWILQKKSRAPFMTEAEEVTFDQNWDFLYGEFRTSNEGIFHYYFVYLIRRMLYVLICFALWEQQYVIIQIFANIWLSLLFVVYLIRFHPFFDMAVNKL